MKKLLVPVISTLFLLMLTSSAFAYTFLEDWIFDPDGAGGVSSVTVPNFLDVVGGTTVTNTYLNATDFTFTETANFDFTGYGLPTVVSPIIAGHMSAIFTGSGSGTLFGALIFSSGTLTIDYDGSTIAIFNLIDGHALLDAGVVPNGIITTIFEATSLAPDTWFTSAGLDLSTAVPQEFVLGFGTTNASLVSNSLVGAPSAGDVQNLVIGNNGQLRLAVVPEPSTFLLLGGGLVSLGFIARRRKQ